MSWLARSISDSLDLDKEDEEDITVAKNTRHNELLLPIPNDILPARDLRRETTAPSTKDHESINCNVNKDQESGDSGQRHEVQKDLSEFGDSLKRQFLGMASFLAPPQSLSHHESNSIEICSESEDINLGHHCESTNNSQIEDWSNVIENVVGITEEVLAFATNVAHHPETWLDFPLCEEEEFNDFYISDVQKKHALAVEYLAPSLAALRIELCPAHMSEGYFWMVYFVLLHSRLNHHDAELLSSPQIVEARAIWMQELRKQTEDESNGLEEIDSKETEDSTCYDFMTRSLSEKECPFEPTIPWKTIHHDTTWQIDTDIRFIDKSVINEDPPPKVQDKEIISIPSAKLQIQDDSDEDNDWLKEDNDLIGYFGASIMLNEEEISFSDLEDDIDWTMPVQSKIISAEW